MPCPVTRVSWVLARLWLHGTGSPVSITYGIPKPQGAPLSGSFRLNFGGQWTANIPFDVATWDFEAAVHAANPAYVVEVEDYNWNPLTGARCELPACTHVSLDSGALPTTHSRQVVHASVTYHY